MRIWLSAGTFSIVTLLTLNFISPFEGIFFATTAVFAQPNPNPNPLDINQSPAPKQLPELNYPQEVEVLTRLGETAQQENRTEDLQAITQRLREIAAEEIEIEVWFALGEAYEVVQLAKESAQAYQRWFEQARDSLEPETQRKWLQRIAKLYLNSFQYPASAQVYEDLLSKLQIQPSINAEVVQTLQQLAYIYDQMQQPDNAVRVKQNLLEIYQSQKQVEKVAALKIALAQDYLTLNQAETASQYYQEAFQSAWELEQLDDAKDALEQLGQLYALYDELDYALEVYQELLKVQQHSYSYYGLMMTYDKMGKILLQQGDRTEALGVYQQALALARSLNHRESYFNEQVEILLN